MNINSFVRRVSCFTAIVMLSACGQIKYEDYRERHQLVVNEEVVSIQIDASSGAIGKNDVSLVKSYITDFIKRGDGRVEIATYFEKNKLEKAKNKAFAIAGDLINLGLRREEIFVQPVLAKNKEQMKYFKLSFKAYKVQVPQCGKWDKANQAFSWSNQPNDNFGCATQKNIGLMVANPRDLIKMRKKQGRSSARAMDVLGKYSVGAETASQSDVNAVLTGGDN